MANPTTGMFQTLVAASSAASQNLQFANAFVDSIYWDYQPVVATPYTTLNVLIPLVNEGNVVDIQAGPIQPVDYSYNQVAITFDKHFSETFVIKSWDQIRTPADLERLFVRPAFESLLRKVNRTIAALVLAGNTAGYFNSYTTVTGTGGASTWTRKDLTTAWSYLVNAGVPVTDQANMFFIMAPLPYANMLQDTAFIYQYVVGTPNAASAQNSGVLETQYGMNVKYDQHLTPISGTPASALFFHRYGIAAVTANPPSNNAPHIEETIVMLKNYLPVQVQMSYSLQDQGWVIHMHLYWGLKVARPEMGVYCITT